MAIDPTQFLESLMAVAVYAVILIILFIAIYIYSSWALMTIAKKAKAKNPWLAWVPIGNLVLTADIAGMHWWPILLFIPYIVLMMISVFLPVLAIPAGVFVMVVSIYTIIWQWKMFEAVERPGWWALVSLIVGGLGMVVLAIGSAAQSLVTAIIGIIITVAGALMSLILIGIAAWAMPTVNGKKNNKKNLKK
jgi:hypothetical protein